MKRISVFVLILTLLCALFVPCAAASTDYASLTVDLTPEEVEILETMEQSIQDNFGIEAYFLYDDTKEGGDDFIAYAESYLEDNAQTEDATLFAISKTSYYVVSVGKAQDLVSNDDADTIYESVKYSDERGEIYNAAAHYFAALQALLAQKVGLSLAGGATTAAPAQTTVPATTAAPTAAPATTEAQNTPAIPTEIANKRGERLNDDADLLSDAEEAALLERLNTLSEQLQFDVVVVTAKSIGTRTPMEFADDYYDYNGFGFDGKDKDGCLLLISMADRDWWVSTRGEGITALDSDYFIDYLEIDEFYNDLKDGDYNSCFLRFTDLVEDFVTEARENKPYSPQHRYNDLQNKLIGVVISLVIGLVIAAIVTLAKRRSYLHAVQSKAGAGEYLVNGSVRLLRQDDRFINTAVTRTRRVQESSSSSSGGSHTSSSGASHGGGGGKF